jgi:hypothetical protein
MLVPSTVTNDVEPPSGGGATSHQAAPMIANVERSPTMDRKCEPFSDSGRTDGATYGRAVHSMLARAITALDYCVATTVSCVAATTVACGEVVLHVTLPAAFAQVYHDPPAASCALTVLAAVGEIVNAT